MFRESHCLGIYKTTPDFLRTFGLQSLEELPEIEKVDFAEPILEDVPAETSEENAVKENV